MIDNVFTISQLNNFIRDVINCGFPNSVWLCGEIQGYNRNKDKKHVFFELCEKNQVSNEIVARIGLVIFAGKKAYISDILKKAENAFQLKDDIEVKFLCRVDFYSPHGAVRLIVENIDPVYTLGKIAQDRQKLIALLKTKGTLEENKKLPLSDVSLRVGLITAFDSAAYNDFISELERSGFGFNVFFVNSSMQGKRVEKEVCHALKVLNAMQNLDCIVITRGGGSIADLSCFDNKAIAEEIASSQVAILSGIGHEINLTVTDMAAHTFAKTPTAIAQFLVGRVRDSLVNLEEKLAQMIDCALEKIANEEKRLKYFAFDLQNNTLAYLKIHNQRIFQLLENLKYQPIYLLQGYRNVIKSQKENLLRAIHLRVEHEKTKIRGNEKLINLASPERTLQRGFSITRTNKGALLKKISQACINEEIVTSVLGGQVYSRVSSVNKEDDNGHC